MIEAGIHPAFGGIAALLQARTGLLFAANRVNDAERGARRAMAKVRMEDAADYLAALESGRIAIDDLVAELAVHETYFFRHPSQFDFVRRRILPELTSGRGGGHRLRIWSAGCSTGEEAYSLAILLDQEGLAGRSSVIGTDLCRSTLSTARTGRYRAWSIRGADDAFIERYFHVDDDGLSLDDRIRSRVAFSQLNLLSVGYPSLAIGVWQSDLILCRNVLMYLDPAATRAVAVRLFESLAAGGWLITGPSDPPLGAYAPFETVATDSGVFYRKSAPGHRIAQRLGAMAAAR